MGKCFARVAAFSSILMLGIAMCASASTRMWLTDISGVEKSEIFVSPSSDFDVAVYLNTDIESLMLGVALAYDRADTPGLGAIALDNKLALKNSSVSSLTWTANTNAYPLEMPTVKGGLQYGGAGDKAYGVCGVKSVLFGNGSAFTNAHICTVQLTNHLAVGESYYLKLWDGPNPENGFTSFIQKTDGTYIQDGMAYSLKVTAAPEPGSLVAILGGLVGLGGMTARRSRRGR